MTPVAPAMTTDDKIDALLSVVGRLAESVETLTQHVALADTAESAPTDDPGVHFSISQDDPYLDLVEMGSDNALRRAGLARDLGVDGTPAGAELVAHGARGFYRSLLRDDGQERIELPRDLARRLVEDALLEDPREAEHMGHDLLKVWQAEDSDSFADRIPDHLRTVIGA